MRYKYGNVYIHLDFTCLQNYCNTEDDTERKVAVEDITIDDDILVMLSNDHLRVLKSKRFLKAIVNNKKKEWGY